MRHIFVLSALLLVQFNLLSQTWSFKEQENSFDGKVKFAFVNGVGTDNIYDSPFMMVNYFEKYNKLNIYFGDAGFSGCDNRLIYLVIDGKSSDMQTYQGISNSENDTWFIGLDPKYVKAVGEEIEYVLFRGLLNDLKEGSKLEVRLVSDCNQNDLTFSLKGSSNVIDLATLEWIEYKEEYFRNQKEREAEEREERQKREAEEREERQKREAEERKRKRIEDSLRLAKIEEQRNAKEMMIANRPILVSQLKTKYPQSNFKVISVKQSGEVFKNQEDYLPYFRTEDGAIAVIDLSYKDKNYFKIVYYEGYEEVNLFIKNIYLKKYQ